MVSGLLLTLLESGASSDHTGPLLPREVGEFYRQPEVLRLAPQLCRDVCRGAIIVDRRQLALLTWYKHQLIFVEGPCRLLQGDL